MSAGERGFAHVVVRVGPERDQDVGRSPRTPAARAAYMRTCQVGCCDEARQRLRRRCRSRRASDTRAWAGACHARGRGDQLAGQSRSDRQRALGGRARPAELIDRLQLHVRVGVLDRGPDRRARRLLELAAPRIAAPRAGPRGFLVGERDLASCARARRSRASVPAASRSQAAHLRVAIVRAPRSITDGVAWLPVTSAAMARRRMSADRGSAAGRCAVAAQRSRSHGALAERRQLLRANVRASDSSPRTEPVTRRRLGVVQRIGRRQLRDEHALRLAPPAPRVSYGRRPSAAAISPQTSHVFRLASCAARASSSVCTCATAAGVRAICASAPGRFGADADAVVQRRRDPADQVGPLQPADRANRRAPLPPPCSAFANQVRVARVLADEDLLERRGLCLRRRAGLRRTPGPA